MSDLVGNPEDRFSHNEATMLFTYGMLSGLQTRSLVLNTVPSD